MWFVTHMSTPASLPLSSLAQGLALIGAGPSQPVAQRGARDRAVAALILLIQTCFSHIAAQLQALAARLAAGLPPVPPPTSTAHHQLGAPRLPETTASTGQVQAAPAEPEMPALPVTAPSSGRIPRPPCRIPASDPGPALRASPGSPPADHPPVLPWTPAAPIIPAFAETPDPSARAPPG